MFIPLTHPILFNLYHRATRLTTHPLRYVGCCELELLRALCRRLPGAKATRSRRDDDGLVDLVASLLLVAMPFVPSSFFSCS